MEYKTDAQRRMSEVLLSLGLKSTYYASDGFFIVKQGEVHEEKLLIHEGDFQDDEISSALKKSYTCIRFTQDGRMTYDADGEIVQVKTCRTCGLTFLCRKPAEGMESCCPDCGQNSVMYLTGNGSIPDWYGKEEEQGLIDMNEALRQLELISEKHYNKFKKIIDRLSGTPLSIILDNKKQQEMYDLTKKFPNMREPIEYLLQCAGTATFKKSKALTFKPFVLVGSPGCGKTAFATELSRIIMGKYALKFDLGNEVADFALTGCESNFTNGKPGLIATALLADDEGGQPLRNPIIHMDELDKVKGKHEFSVETVFYAILERCNARRFYDNYLGLNIDASGINYIFTANTLEGIPAPILNRLRVFSIRDYTPEELRGCVLDSFYENWLACNDMEREYLPARLSDEVRERILEESHNDPRSVEDAIGKVFMETTTVDQESGHAIALFSSEEMGMGWKKFRGSKPISMVPWEPPAAYCELQEDIIVRKTFPDGFELNVDEAS